MSIPDWDGREPARNYRPARLRRSAAAVPRAGTRVRSDQRSLFPNGPGATDLYRCSPGAAGVGHAWTSIWTTPTLASANDTREAAREHLDDDRRPPTHPVP